MENKFVLPSPEVLLESDFFREHSVSVSTKRDDLIHPLVSGNKWRKLKYNVERCRQEKYSGILTFGGAYSNHLRATAAVGNILDLATIGIVRGDELTPASNETLKCCTQDGMQLVFTTREEYALREEKYYEEELRRRHGNYLIVPEGGANFHGVLGCVEIIKELEGSYDHLFLAGGTGTTAAGLLYADLDTQIHLVSSLKGGEFLQENIRLHLMKAGFSDEEITESMKKLSVHADYHFGGYAKYTDELIDFMNDFYEQTKVPLDQVYTAKAAYALVDQIKKQKIQKDERVLFLHTGGLQGTRVITSVLDFV